MEITGFGLIPLLLFLLSSGGNDLLDYLPTAWYWEQKEVAVRVESMLTEARPPSAQDVSGLLDDLGSVDAAERQAAADTIRVAGRAALPALRELTTSDDLEVARAAKALVSQIIAESKPKSVRQLMAIRTLGELKDAAALPALRTLATSEEPFVGDYAAEAIRRIEGKELAPRDRTALTAALEKDVGLLPAETAVVVQVAPGTGGLAPTFEADVAKATLSPDQRKRRLENLSEEVLALAERLGNIRVDGITLAVTGDIGERAGYVVAILRGEYDPEAAATVARQEQMTVTTVEGTDVFSGGPEGVAFFPSRDRAVFYASPSGDAGPVKAIVQAVHDGRGAIDRAKDLAPLLEAVDRSVPLWGIARISPELKALPLGLGLKGLESLTIQGTQPAPDRIEVTLSAVGSDAESAKASVAQIEASVTAALDGLNKLADFMVPLRPLRDALASVRLKAEGTDVSGSAAYAGSTTSLLAFSMMPYTEPIQPPAIAPAPDEKIEE